MSDTKESAVLLIYMGFGPGLREREKITVGRLYHSSYAMENYQPVPRQGRTEGQRRIASPLPGCSKRGKQRGRSVELLL